MSAMIGMGDSLTIRLSASTSFSRGTAQRTRSAPASAAVRIWRMVASYPGFSVFVIVWTAPGAPPPIGTPPTHIWRLEAMDRGYPSPLADLDAGSRAAVDNGNRLRDAWGSA